MHRIDGPGATVDKKFTEGDPVGGTPATVVTAAWMNDVQEELVSVLAAAGIAPVKGTQDQLLKAIRSISTGVAGGVRNARMAVTVASATATLTADEVAVKTTLGGSAWLLPGFNKTINLATTGAGGMDTGTVPANGYVGLYAIYNPTTGASALLAVNAATLLPNIYGGANMPSGYTASALLTVVATAGSQFIPCLVQDRKVLFSYNSVFATSGGVTLTATSIAAAVPLNAKRVQGHVSLSVTGTGTTTAALAASSVVPLNGIGCQFTAVSGTTAGTVSCQFPFPLLDMLTAQTIYYSLATTGTGAGLSIFVNGYEI